MEQWQYEALSFRTADPLAEEQKELDKLGKDGWELTSTIYHARTERTIHYMKRRVPETTAHRG